MWCSPVFYQLHDHHCFNMFHVCHPTWSSTVVLVSFTVTHPLRHHKSIFHREICWVCNTANAVWIRLFLAVKTFLSNPHKWLHIIHVYWPQVFPTEASDRGFWRQLARCCFLGPAGSGGWRWFCWWQCNICCTESCCAERWSQVDIVWVMMLNLLIPITPALS